jgi:hypothetical protein
VLKIVTVALLALILGGCATVAGGTMDELAAAQSRCSHTEATAQTGAAVQGDGVPFGPFSVAAIAIQYHHCMRAQGWVQHKPITWAKETWR